MPLNDCPLFHKKADDKEIKVYIQKATKSKYSRLIFFSDTIGF